MLDVFGIGKFKAMLWLLLIFLTSFSRSAIIV